MDNSKLYLSNVGDCTNILNMLYIILDPETYAGYYKSIQLPINKKQPMGLALNFLLTILIELPIIGFFFKRRKRKAAILMALLINIISWSIAHIIFFSTDINIYYVAIGLAIGEAIAFHQFLECNWKKAIIMSLIVNSLSFTASQLVPIDIEIFPAKPGVLRTAVQ